MIKAVIFDMGGVVLPLDIPRCMDNFRKKAGLVDIDKYLDAYHQRGFIGDLEAGKIDEDEFYTECLSHCTPGTSRETVAECFASLLEPCREEALTLFRELQGQYDLYILSNNNPISKKAFCAEMIQRGIDPDKVFRKQFYSFQMKLLKPSREFYEKAIEGTGVKPGEILFIDDSQVNCDAASALGIKAVYYDVNTSLYELVKSSLAAFNG